MQPLPFTQRVQFGLLTAALVFVTTCLASWVAMRDSGTMEYEKTVRVRIDLQFVHEELASYAEEHGEYPATLSELDFPTEHPKYTTRDPWGKQFHYSKTDRGFKLASLGRDGKPGGQGLDADVYSEPTAESRTRLPLSQFLFQAAGSKVVLRVALLASIFAGAVSYMSTAPRKSQPTSRISFWLNFVLQVVSAAFVAVILAALYVAMSQSGH